MKKKLNWILFTAMLAALPEAGAQSDVKSAGAPTNAPPRIYRDRIEPHWFAGADGATNKFWYRVDTGKESREFIVVNADEGKRAPAFDHAKVAEALARLTGGKVDAARLPVAALEFARDGKTVMLEGTGGTNWSLDLQSYSLSPGKDETSDERRLPSTRQSHPSRDGGAETEITFVNRLDLEVSLFWVDADGRRIPYGSVKPGESRPQHTFAGHVWLVANAGGNVLAVFDAEERPGLAILDGRDGGANSRRWRRGGRRSPPEEARPASPGQQSPDGKWEAVVRGHNLCLRDVQTDKEQPLTFDANPNSTYARSEEADRAIEMNYETRDPETPTPEVYWSPDSRWLVAMRLQPGTQRRVYLIQSSPDDQLQPKLDSYPYLKPGDQVPIRKPHLFDIEAKREIPVSDALFANPWSISDLRWETNSARFTFLFNQRGHQVLRLLGVDARTGSVQPIVEEQSQTFICYSAKYFAEFVDETGEVIWMSERDGWNHLYLYDARTGRVKNQITKGQWVVRGVDRVDHEKRQIWFQAGGLHPAEDPYYVHYCRINFDGSGLTVLTEGDGTHSIQLAPDNRFLIDTWSRVDLPPVNELRRTQDGKRVCRLEETDAADLFASGWKPPERFVAKGRDGATDIYGVIVRPGSFDPGKKYPVIENIYAGPQDSFVPKAFGTANQMQKLADRGFIVVQVDGMGTSNRSKKFHDVCWKNLADAGFPDRILWIKAAAAKHPGLDLTRVGIYGTSAGGQNALRGLLDHGDFYKAGVADSGCHDNRMDKVWWNEEWLGWPVDESYVRSSNVTDAHKLQGRLLLMVGEMDKNVDPASTMQVVNALIKADNDFELLVMPGVGHGVARTPYGARRLTEFFVRTLQPEPDQKQSP